MVALCEFSTNDLVIRATALTEFNTDVQTLLSDYDVQLPNHQIGAKSLHFRFPGRLRPLRAINPPAPNRRSS
jgi:hypothetical protein